MSTIGGLRPPEPDDNQNKSPNAQGAQISPYRFDIRDIKGFSAPDQTIAEIHRPESYAEFQNIRSMDQLIKYLINETEKSRARIFSDLDYFETSAGKQDLTEKIESVVKEDVKSLTLKVEKGIAHSKIPNINQAKDSHDRNIYLLSMMLTRLGFPNHAMEALEKFKDEIDTNAKVYPEIQILPQNYLETLCDILMTINEGSTDEIEDDISSIKYSLENGNFTNIQDHLSPLLDRATQNKRRNNQQTNYFINKLIEEFKENKNLGTDEVIIAFSLKLISQGYIEEGKQSSKKSSVKLNFS